LLCLELGLMVNFTDIFPADLPVFNKKGRVTQRF